MIDVKYVIPLANMFSIKADDIVFPEIYDNKERQFACYSEWFKQMLNNELADKKLYNKLVTMYIDNKLEIVSLLKKYDETRDEKVIQNINSINKFGFVFLGDNPVGLNFNHYEKMTKAAARYFGMDDSFENSIETAWIWWNEKMKNGTLFLDACGTEKTIKNGLEVFYDRIYMLNFIYSNCTDDVFNRYINSFSQNYKNQLLKNIVEKDFGKISKGSKNIIKRLLRADCKYIKNGEDCTIEIYKAMS